MKRLFLLCFAAAICAAQGPKIFIVTDMEGVGGVNNADEQLLPGQRRYEESRRLLTGEVKAAVVGALEAGASQVVIWDGHDASRSLSIDEIHPRAQLIQGRDTPADYYLAEKLYDGITISTVKVGSGFADDSISTLKVSCCIFHLAKVVQRNQREVNRFV